MDRLPLVCSFDAIVDRVLGEECDTRRQLWPTSKRLHQIGNCESNLGNHQIAAELYLEGAKIFHFVGMEEYLSNALGELGYSLLEIDLPELADRLDDGLVDHGLTDLANDIRRVFDSARPLNHQQCLGAIRKLFGTVILLSLSGHGKKLAGCCTELANVTVVAVADQVDAKIRDHEEIFPIMMVDTALRLAVVIAQGELDLEESGDITHGTEGEILRLFCLAHGWAQNVMRVIDWLAVYLTRRWRFRDVDADRLRAFARNFDDDVEDYLDLVR